ncbi:hypothetical protein [Nonomuraea sp. NPDC002799]
MIVTCELCSAEVADLANVCSRCAHGLRLDLAAIPELDHELDVTAYGQARMVFGNAGGGRSADEPLPLNLGADARGRALKAVLASWCALIADQRGVPAPLDGLPTMSRWMLGHVEWLRHHQAGADAVVEIRDAVRDVRRAIDRPSERVFAGTCGTCGGSLYASQSARDAACRVCLGPKGEPVSYNVSARRSSMLASMADMHMAPPEAAFALSTLIGPIRADLIRTWAARDKLFPASVDEQGRNLYRLGDIAKLMVPAKQAV